MKKTTLTPINADQLLDWVARLDRNGCYYRLLHEGSGKIEMFEIDAEVVLGIPRPKDPAKSKTWHVAGILLALAVIVTLCTIGQPVPKDAEAPELTLDDRFGAGSVWNTEYGGYVANNYLRNPRSYRCEEVRIIPIDQDSFVHVLIFTGVNDFNVRKEHSITSVVETGTGQVLRVVSQQ